MRITIGAAMARFMRILARLAPERNSIDGTDSWFTNDVTKIHVY